MNDLNIQNIWSKWKDVLNKDNHGYEIEQRHQRINIIYYYMKEFAII